MSRSPRTFQLRRCYLALFLGGWCLLGSANAVLLVAADAINSRGWLQWAEPQAMLDLARASRLYPWDARLRTAPAVLVGHQLQSGFDVSNDDLQLVRSVRSTLPTSLYLMSIEYRLCQALKDDGCAMKVAYWFNMLAARQQRGDK